MMSYSVLIRTRNSAKTIKDTLFSMLSQTELPSEIIIVDNGSTDQTLALSQKIAGSLLSIIHFPTDCDFNYSKAINIGIEQVKSEFVLILSSHIQVTDQNCIEKALVFLTNEPDCCSVNLGQKKLTDTNKQCGEPQITKNSRFSNRAQIMRKSAWLLERFDENIITCEDQLWEKKMKLRGSTFGLIPSSIWYQNPYANFAKLYQEAYVMAKSVDNKNVTLFKMLKDCKNTLIKLMKCEFLAALSYVKLGFIRLLGALKFELHYSSDSYRK